MPQSPVKLAEVQRLDEANRRTHNWKRWGPYLAERQWGTVREDYSADGDSWNYFPHDHARSRTYRWGEDGLLGITDRQCRLCFALALWNGRDPILKERLFGLTNPEGNHGEDVKELYYYLDSSPTHSYLKALYKYPQAEYPYAQLVEENERRGKGDDEYELIDTGVFDGDRYFDVQAEYAKAGPNDMLIRVTLTNRAPAGSEPAALHVLPTLWFRNTWSWGRHGAEGHGEKPSLKLVQRKASNNEGEGAVIEADHRSLGRFDFLAENASDGTQPQWLFTDNESNFNRLFGKDNFSAHVKDAFHRHVIDGEQDAVNPKQEGTKAAPWYRLTLEPGASVTLRMRLHAVDETPEAPFGKRFDNVFARRVEETDAFYASVLDDQLTDEQRHIARQSHAGLLWTKQFYAYIIEQWLEGDPALPPPPVERLHGRNSDWRQHLYNRDVISMPDKWEYPWYAVWDLAFHMIPFARIDPDFAKRQLRLFLREWYMHPSGAMPAYEFNFSDVNPPVHAWACWRVYKIAAPRGERDRDFLERVFQKLLLNFTWWVNRKDFKENHIFAGGFLGLDNIGVFDRSQPFDDGTHLEQADGTAWMAFYCGTMLSMALELAEPGNAYEDMATKFFEHYIHIADAINCLDGTGLWDADDGFYYDRLHVHDETHPLKVRSLVGLLPLITATIITRDTYDRLPGFRKRTEWFLKYRPELAQQITYLEAGGYHKRTTEPAPEFLLAIPSRERFERVLAYLLDENEFLSPFGIRSLSKHHAEHPFRIKLDGQKHQVAYEPGEARSDLFGGNSNWRGPVWFPVNFLIIEALERYHHFYGNSFKVAFPTGSTNMLTLGEVADELRARLARLFLPDAHGQRPAHGGDQRYASDPHFKDLLLFYEYFHADTGRGLGASHQTGWTALVSECLRKSHR